MEASTETFSSNSLVSSPEMQTTNASQENLYPESQDRNVARLSTIVLITFAGTIMNGLSFIVMTRKSMRQHSISVFLPALAVMDSLVLWSVCTSRVYEVVTGIDYQVQSTWGCRMSLYQIGFPGTSGSWLIVAVSVDRFIASVFPLKANIHCTVARAKITTVVLLLVIFFWQMHIFVLYDLSEHGCAMTSSIDSTTALFMVYFSVCIYSFIPTLSIFFLNICIVSAMIRSSRKVHVQPLSSAAIANQINTRKITIVAITLSVSHFILTVPLSVLFVVGMSGYQQQWLVDLKSAADYAMYVNNSINFVLYALTGQKFRNELKKLVCGTRSVGQNLQTESNEVPEGVNTN